MKALSIKQPWAGMILSCGKDVENRRRGTNYRGHLLIHASKKIDDLAARKFGLREPSGTGEILGYVKLVDCTKVITSEWHELGMVGWYFKNPIVFAKPIPWRGHLWLFDVPVDKLWELM